MKLRNLLAVSVTAFTLLSCNDSDNNLNPAPNQGELAAITVKVKGNADTRALTGEETGSANENDINSLEFFVFNNDGLSRSITSRQAWYPTINTHSLSTPVI